MAVRIDNPTSTLGAWDESDAARAGADVSVPPHASTGNERAASELTPDEQLRRARTAQQVWAAKGLRQRLRVLRTLRSTLAEAAADVAGVITQDQSWRKPAEVLSAELLPLCDAIRFVERNAPGLLKPRRVRRGRPLWLTGERLEVRREPYGVVLVIGPSNYPLMLAGVQAVQALAAGNVVVVKPGRDGGPVWRMMRELAARSGLPEGVLTVLGEEPEAARQMIDAGVDLVVLTGSNETGRAVLEAARARPTPTLMELSGCDAVLVRRDAKLKLAVDAIRFGLTYNAGRTCVAPRRVYVHSEVAESFITQLSDALRDAAPAPVEESQRDRIRSLIEDALSRGGVMRTGGWVDGDAGGGRGPASEMRLKPVVLSDVPNDAPLCRSDVFAPVLSVFVVDDDVSALALARACPYALGAALFGSRIEAKTWVDSVDAGVVMVNDLIAPVSDPRLPLEPRGSSGFGVTRGAAGLLAMTRCKAVVDRMGTFRPHYQPTAAEDAGLFANYLRAVHGVGVLERGRAAVRLVVGLVRRGGQ